jgi:hypothetical protein
MKRIVFLVLLAGVLLLIVRFFVAADQPEKQLRQRTPPGTGYDAVLAFARERGWRIYEEPNHGFLKQQTGNDRVIGTTYIRADLPSSRHVFGYRSTSVFWGFDENRKLIEFWVWRTYDAL